MANGEFLVDYDPAFEADMADLDDGFEDYADAMEETYGEYDDYADAELSAYDYEDVDW